MPSLDGKTTSASVQQYYVAVGTPEVKATTLVDLLLALQANGPFGMAVLCGSRDELDNLVSWLTPLQRTAVYYLHSDMSDDARLAVLGRFARGLEDPASPARKETAQAVASAPQQPSMQSDREGEERLDDADRKAGPDISSSAERQEPEPVLAHVLVSTDVGMRIAEGAGLPPKLALIVHYDLPTRKETYSKRLGLFSKAAQIKMAVYFVVAGEVSLFRSLEGFAGNAVIDVMPVHISDIFPAQRS